MNSNPGVNEMLALLESLKGAIQDFAAREEKLNGDFRAQSAAELRAFESRREVQEAESSERIAAAQEACRAESVRWESRFEKRKAAINQAHFAARKRVLDQVTGEDSRRKYKIQEAGLTAERKRDADLANAAARLQAFREQLTQAGQAADQLGKSVRKVFSGYRRFRKLLAPGRAWPEPDLTADEDRLFEEYHRLSDKTGEAVKRFRRRPWPLFFRLVPLRLLLALLLGFILAVVVLHHFNRDTIPWRDAGAAGALAVVVVGVYLYGGRMAGPAAREIAGNLARIWRLLDVCFEKAELRCQQDQERIRQEFKDTTDELNDQWRRTVKGGIELMGSRPVTVDEKAARVSAKNEQYHRIKLEQLQGDHTRAVAELRRQTDAQARQLAEEHAANTARLEADHQARWNALAADWKRRVQPIYDAIAAANAAADQLFPPWELPRWQQWTPPDRFKNAAKFGRLEVDLADFADNLPKDPRLALPGPARFSAPLSLVYPLQGSILFENAKTGNEEAIDAINNILFRLLSTTPPGKLSFTIFDPVGLGQNFAGLMHLADYEESQLTSRIWTQTTQFEEKLAELNEHMEKVIQMYLRNEYETIAEYNAQAGTIAEKYHFLVIASFPVNFSDTAARRLRNIATSGARCGVYTLIQWDQRNALPPDFVPDELRKNSVCLMRAGQRFELARWREPGVRLVLDAPPSPEFATHFLHEVGRTSKDSSRVEVPFEQVAPPDAEVWATETTEELRVPIGRSGATKLQYLEIGKGTRQHALIAGKTGSGKSTLFHVIVTNLALWCSPEQVEFYLVDFKKGVEFKCYANRRLPHAKVVAIESDREFGLSVLERVDEELRRRGDLFRKLGVQDVPGYKKAGGTEPMPRSLLIIDEFQEFFTEEDRVSQGAAVLLDRIVRQGRAFGIHVLLGSQTLGGAYTLARATIGQMVVRIALQCNEADAYLIMDQDNPAPRLLSRPGEGIYNDSAGAIEGNSPFQAVWLPEDVRDGYLAGIREHAERVSKDYAGPFVFEGNAPATVQDNLELRALLRRRAARPAVQPRVWLGAPNAVKGPTEAAFQRQSGSNLLIVGQSEEPALTLVAVALVSLAAQYPKGTVRFLLLDSTPPGFPQREFLERVVRAIPHEVAQVKNSDLADTMSRLAEDLNNRAGAEQTTRAPETFALIHGLQNFKKLKQEDEFGFSSGGDTAAQPSAVLQNLISEGPARGIHVIATFDTYNNVSRFLGRKTLSDFEMRVLFQMSAADSASLIDEPDASTLGLHRALYYNDREGYRETFRPYALPGNDWIEEVARQLKGSAR